MDSKYNKEKFEEICKRMLGDEFVTSFAVDFPQIKRIQVFVKTTTEFIWGDRFGSNPAYDYLDELGYTHMGISAAREIEGGWINVEEI